MTGASRGLNVVAASGLELDELARSLFAALGIGLLVLDEQRRVELINDVLAEWLGLEPRTVRGAPVERVLPGAWVDAVDARLGVVAAPEPPRPGAPQAAPRGPSPSFTLPNGNGNTSASSLEIRRLATRPGWVVAVRVVDASDGPERSHASAVPESAVAPKPLSPREREVLRWIAEGASTKSIAARLGIAATTVDTYRRQIMGKLKLRTIAELTKYAVRQRLTPP